MRFACNTVDSCKKCRKNDIVANQGSIVVHTDCCVLGCDVCPWQEDDDRRFPLLSLATSTVVYDALCSALFAGVCLLIASRSMRARSNAVVC